MCSDARDRNRAAMKANNAQITGGIIRDLITMGHGRSGSARVQDGDVRGKRQECSCLRVFGTDRSRAARE